MTVGTGHPSPVPAADSAIAVAAVREAGLAAVLTGPAGVVAAWCCHLYPETLAGEGVAKWLPER